MVLANYSLLTIPPHLWYGIRSLAPSVTIVANCPDLATEPNEFDRKPVDSPDIPCRLPTIG